MINQDDENLANIHEAEEQFELSKRKLLWTPSPKDDDYKKIFESPEKVELRKLPPSDVPNQVEDDKDFD